MTSWLSLPPPLAIAAKFTTEARIAGFFIERDFMEWVIGGFVVLIVLGAIFKPSRCDVCGTGFKKKYYTWTIEGKKQNLCPICNSKMSRWVSNQRFTDRFGR